VDYLKEQSKLGDLSDSDSIRLEVTFRGSPGLRDSVNWT